MRQSIRALGWTITIVTLLVFIFLGFSVYSLVQLVMGQGIKIGEMRFNVSDGNFILSTPFSINNTSYFDITEMGITSVIKDYRGVIISDSTTKFEMIPSGRLETRFHDISISIYKMIENNLTYLLFTNSEIYMDNLVDLRYANIIGFKVTVSNTSMPWRAPLSLSIGEPSTPEPIPQEKMFVVEVPFTLENRSPISLEGTVSVNIYNQDGILLGFGNKTISIKSGLTYSDKIEIRLTLESLQKYYTGKGYLEIQFENPMFSFKLPRVIYG